MIKYFILLSLLFLNIISCTGSLEEIDYNAFDPSESQWVDNFENGSLDASKWTTGGEYNGASGSTWSWSFTESGGMLDIRVWGPTSGITYGASAWVHSVYDFKDGNNHVINFTWGADVKSYHTDIFAIQISNGWTPGNYPPTGHMWFANDVAGSFVNLYYMENQSDLGQTARSIVIKNNVAALYSGSNGEGSLLQSKSLIGIDHWYIRFIHCDATSSGYPDGDNHLFIYDVSSGVDNSTIPVYTYVTKWGSYGTGNGQFNYPQGIGIDSSGYVYVADNNNDRIQVFNSNGTYITQWGSTGSGNGQFSYPWNLVFDTSGYIYVNDSYNNRIQKINSNYTYNTQWGSSGAGNGQFNRPQGIAIDLSGNIYVSDTENNRIQKFSSNGVYSTQWGTLGTGNGQFNYPAGITIDSSGYVYVADGINNRVQKFNSSGAYSTQWGTTGTGNGQFSSPADIAIDTSGLIYVSDAANHRIQVFNSNGAYITQWGSNGSGNGQFDYPRGIVIDSSGYVYVVDSHGHRVQKFQRQY